VSKNNDRESAPAELDQRIDEIIEILPEVVRHVCRKLNHNSSPMDHDGYVQGIFLSLINHDCRTLRSFDGTSKILNIERKSFYNEKSLLIKKLRESVRRM
jgi:hypothetical protein